MNQLSNRNNKYDLEERLAKFAKHWLRLLARSNPERKEEIRKLWKEASELTLIFAKITRTSKGK